MAKVPIKQAQFSKTMFRALKAVRAKRKNYCLMWAEISTREKNGGYIARTPRLERFGTISDFIGEITEGKFDVKNSGYYSHTVSYYKQRGFQKGAETWATFFGMKITRDTAGLEMMKSLLPKTYAAYSKHYSQIAKVLSGRGGTKKKS